MSPSAGRRWPLSRRWTVALILLALAFAALRSVAALAPQPQDTAFSTEQVVIVGVTGRPQLTAVDRTVLGPRLDQAQIGAVAVRPRYVGSCAAAGWATLGAGRRTDVGGRCTPQVSGGRVLDWAGYQEAAAANRGDARLGTLAAAVPGCVAAVGPGAALAAARPDGTLARYTDVAALLAGDLAAARSFWWTGGRRPSR